MRRIPILVLLLCACADDAADAPEGGAAAPTPAPPAAAVAADTLDADRLARGRGVYETVCAACHALEPPPSTAPTLREVVDRYHEAFLDPAEALDHLAEYIREPAPARSQLPQVMIDEWGVMPPQPLPDEDLAAVAYFIWHLPPSPAPPDTTTG